MDLKEYKDIRNEIENTLALIKHTNESLLSDNIKIIITTPWLNKISRLKILLKSSVEDGTEVG